MKKYLLFGLVLMIVLSGCNGGSKDKAVNGLKANDPVAEVNGEPITRGEFDKRVQKMTVVYEVQGEKVDTQKLGDNVLEGLIKEKIVNQVAREKGVAVTLTTAREELKLIKKNFETEADWQAILDSRHLTEEDMVVYIQNRLITEILTEKLGGPEQYEAYIAEKLAGAELKNY